MAKPDRAILWPERFLFIGCGNMAGAMLSRWLDLGLSADRVTVVRPSGQPVVGDVRVVTRIDEPVAPGTVVLLGFKPQQLASVADGMADLIGPDTTLLSILAGVPLGRLREAFPATGGIVRCMPNLPVRIGKGVCVLQARRCATAEQKAVVTGLCAALGLVEWLDDERLFDAATALAGCGPAFVYRFIDALGEAASDLGLDPASAARMALATVEGAALNAAISEVTPQAMADAVASKGGMTRMGLDVLDSPDGLAALIAETLRAARDRGAELAALSEKVSSAS